MDQVETLLGGHAATMALYAAAKLGIADRLAQGPLSAAELAAGVGADTPALYRLLRALASVGVFSEISPGTFALTDSAERLRSDVPDTLLAAVLFAGEFVIPAWREIVYSVTTGETAFERVFGAPVFPFLEDHPDAGALFDMSQAQGGLGLHAAVADACELAAGEKLVDIGGGKGALVAAVLRSHPGTRAMIFDLPQVIERARAAEHPDCEYVAGSFFQSVPTGADVYMISRVIHDWSDDDAVTILANCRRAMHDGARLLVVERIVPAGDEPHPSKFMDLTMLLMTGGRERTETEFRTLFAHVDLRLVRVIETGTAVSVMEVVPAGAHAA